MSVHEEPLEADGFEEARIGTDWRTGRVVYSATKCIKILMKRDRMNFEEAIEFLEFNTFSAYVGEGTPIFLDDITI